MFSNDRIETAIEVRIEFVIARSKLDAVPLDAVADFENWLAHADMQGLGFLAARDRATVVVAQNKDRNTVQTRVEKPLCTDVEI